MSDPFAKSKNKGRITIGLSAISHWNNFSWDTSFSEELVGRFPAL